LAQSVCSAAPQGQAAHWQERQGDPKGGEATVACSAPDSADFGFGLKWTVLLRTHCSPLSLVFLQLVEDKTFGMKNKSKSAKVQK
jgi:hypothetical protein